MRPSWRPDTEIERGLSQRCYFEEALQGAAIAFTEN